jgi:hypothetical protein
MFMPRPGPHIRSGFSGSCIQALQFLQCTTCRSVEVPAMLTGDEASAGRLSRQRPDPRYVSSTTPPVTTSAAAHSQSKLNQAVRSRLSPSFRYTTHAASIVTVKYASV